MEDDVAVAELGAEDMLSNAGVQKQVTLDCEILEGHEPPTVGTPVLLLDQNRPNVNVFLGGSVIGYVLPSGSILLRKEFQIDQTKARSMSAEVIDVAPFGSRFTVRLT